MIPRKVSKIFTMNFLILYLSDNIMIVLHDGGLILEEILRREDHLPGLHTSQGIRRMGPGYGV
jgi:hypothetical protein